ncbi:unnamed protein product, partial [Rotaria sp. Silwood2]
MTNQTIARIYQYIGMAYFHEKEYDKTSINLKQAYDIVININDLCAKLKSEYQILKEMSDEWGVESLTLYRGLHLSKVEIKRLKQNKRNLISTSLSKDTAKAFAGEGTKASIRGDVEAVIYEITVNFTINA